jgi:hypothetical protein
VNPRAGLDDLEKTKLLTLPGLELRPPSHPARSLSRSQSLYRLGCRFLVFVIVRVLFLIVIGRIHNKQQ